jgi:peptidyl-prolyl cis-trans isomerase D
MNVYFPQYVDERKLYYAAVEQARRLGITATDDEVLEALLTTPGLAPYFKDGKLVRRAEFEAMVASKGGNLDELLSQMREQILMVKLQDVVAENTIVTPKELEEEYKRKYERATVDYLSLTEADVRSGVTVTDADIQKQYDANKAAYQEAEKFGFRVLVLSQDKVSASLQVSEQELRTQYAAALDNFRSAEQVHARHILLATDGKSDAEKKTIRTKADDLLKQAKGGADFAELAKKNSEDSGNASLGGDLGTFPRGQMVKEFEAAAFSMKPNEISGIVTTQFGYHIIQVLERIPSKVTPFENVRADLEREFRTSKLADSLQTTKTQLRADVLKNPAGAAEIAKKFGAEVVTVTDVARGGAIPTLGVTPEIDSVLPALQPNGVSEVLTLPGDRAAVVILDKRTPGRQSTIAEATASIREQLLASGAAKLLTGRAQQAVDRLKKGEDIQAVAKSLGAKVDGASNFGITDSLPGIGPAVFLREAFSKGSGTVIGPTLSQGRTVVAKVISKTDADMAGLPGEREVLLTGLKSARAQQTNRLWMDSLVRNLTDSGDIVVNQAAMQQAIGGMTPRQ